MQENQTAVPPDVQPESGAEIRNPIVEIGAQTASEGVKKRGAKEFFAN